MYVWSWVGEIPYTEMRTILVLELGVFLVRSYFFMVRAVIGEYWVELASNTPVAFELKEGYSTPS